MDKDKRFLGRGSEVLSNEKLYKIVKQLETLSLENDDDLIKNPTIDKALWIDPEDSNDLKYSYSGEWHPFYRDKFRITTEILSNYTPKDPVLGQLWIKDGVLMYFDGMEWRVVKAGDIDNKHFNIATYHNFIIIDPLLAEGEIVVDSTAGMPLRKSQFLIPNTDTSKFFIDGHINEDYETMTNVAIQYETDRIEDKVTSSVYINPNNVMNIKKSLIVINKSDSSNLIRVNTHNKEFYGMTHGRGRLLMRGIDYNITSGNYIELREKAKRKFDFIMVVEYIFGKSKNKGKLLKKITDIERESSASIRSPKDPNKYHFIVFENGVAKSINSNDYDIKDNSITLKDNPRNKNIQILALHIDNVMKIGRSDKNVVSIDHTDVDFVDKPMCLVENNGKFLLKEPEHIEGEKYKVEGIMDNSRYLLFDTKVTHSKDSIVYDGSGTVNKDTIRISTKVDPGDDVVLFIQGRMISSKYYTLDLINQKIIVDDKYDNLSYVLFVDKYRNLILDKDVRNLLVPIYDKDGYYDKSIVYVDEHLICDPGTVLTYNLPNRGYEGEVKKILRPDGTSDWYVYRNQSWKKLEDYVYKDINVLDIDDIKDIDETIEVYDSEDVKEVSIEIERAINQYTDRIEDSVQKINVLPAEGIAIAKITRLIKSRKEFEKDFIKSERISSIREELTFQFKLKEVQFKIPTFFYSDKIKHIDSESILMSLQKDIEREIKRINAKELLVKPVVEYKDGKFTAKVTRIFKDSDYRETIGLIKHLEYTSAGYHEDRDSINLINNFDGSQVITYSYRYSSHIENPREIIEMDIDLKDNEKGFKMSYLDFYTPNKNELSVYLDGVKQYDFNEKNSTEFLFKGEYHEDDGNEVKAIVVSERTERNDSKSSYREIIPMKNKRPGMFNTYTTRNDLYPGYNRLFIDGIRQPSESFEIIDSNTFILKNSLIGEHTEESLMLLEHKSDVSIKDKTITIKDPLFSGIIDIDKYEIDRSILETKEEILIYIDGVLLGNNYYTDEEMGQIVILAKDADNIGRNILFYEKLMEHDELKNELLKQLEEVETYEEKEKILQTIKDMDEEILNMERNSETTITFEWR